MMDKTLGNPMLEAERSASNLLKGEYTSKALVIDSVARIPNLIEFPIFLEDMEYLIPKFFNKKGDVKIDIVKRLVEGDDEDCFIKIKGMLARAQQGQGEKGD